MTTPIVKQQEPFCYAVGLYNPHSWWFIARSQIARPWANDNKRIPGFEG